MKEKPCECRLCKESKRIRSIIKKLGPKDGKWLSDFYNNHCNIEAELEMKTVLLDGSWPSAVEQLTEALKKAKAKAKEQIEEEKPFND
jgi:hypothetical protein